MKYFYATPAQDFFNGMIPLKEIFKKEEFDGSLMPLPEFPLLISKFYLLKMAMHCAYVVAKTKTWEGDIRNDEIYLFGLPDPDSASELLGLVWKQENNGDTFICSPVELPWLNEYLVTNIL